METAERLIDVLQALQSRAQGMDPRRLEELYGDRLCFEDGVSVQTTLPLGTAEDGSPVTAIRRTTLGRAALS
jgi:hypothetical protein